MKDLNSLLRKNIQSFNSYFCQRKAHDNKSNKIYLDANENPYNAPLNRYPNTEQKEIKNKLSLLKRVQPNCIFVGSGTNETIDIIYRCFCEPRIDNVVVIEPTCGLYKSYADINDVEYRKVALDNNFQLSADNVLDACDDKTKVIWICSPNDPTGNELDRKEIENIIQCFDGIVVVDNAYADFSHVQPMNGELHKYPNLIILDSFDHAWGCAALQLATAYAYPEIINVFNKVRYPYSINTLSQERFLQQLANHWDVDKWISMLLMERNNMIEAFKLLPSCEEVYPTDANFFLVKMTNANDIYRFLTDKGIMIYNCSDMPLCNDCLRISVGSKSENAELISALRKYDEQR